MKKIKIISLLMVFALSVFAFAGCSGSGSSSSGSSSSSSSSSSDSAQTYTQDFTLINQTGIDIYELYISPNGDNNWGTSLLASGTTIPNGQSVPIVFNTDVQDQYWDLKVADSAGGSVEWTKIDLFTVSEITLTIENGTPTATFK